MFLYIIHCIYISILFHSECSSEWFDCIGEDEKYVREKEKFYENCTPTTKNSEVPIELLEVTKDKCFENRKCQADIDGDKEETFVGGSSDCILSSPIFWFKETTRHSQQIPRSCHTFFCCLRRQ